MVEPEILERVSLSEMSETLPQRLASIWQTGHQRTQILILIQRHHRERFESHAAGLALQHPTWSLFYRPRKEAEEMAEMGFDSKKASFLFLDIALADLGLYVGPLAKDDWVKEEVVISPAENSKDFSATKWTMFRDPWLASVEVLPFATPPHEVIGNAWLIKTASDGAAPSPSTTQPSAPLVPDTAAPSGDFEGMLAGVSHTFGGPPTETSPAPLPDSLSEQAAPPPTPDPAPPTGPAFEMPSGPISIPNFGSPEPTPEPEVSATLGPVSVPTPEDIPPATPSSMGDEDTSEDDGGASEEDETGDEGDELPAPEETIREELVDTIELLVVGGLSAEQIMESPAFQEVSERAAAAGLDVWNIFLANAGSS
jgi:hypothetical protein